MQFHLSTLFWATLVFATSMSLAGGWGIPCALYLVALLWLMAGQTGKKDDWNATGVRVLAIAGFFVVCLGVLVDPVPHGPRQAGRRTVCANNLSEIGLALADYRERRKCFPPAVVCDASGKPAHSWRTLLLPHLGRSDMYKACDLRQPWNEGKNPSVLGQRFPIYCCPSDGALDSPIGADTSYLAIVGPGTVWDAAVKAAPSASTQKTSTNSNVSQDDTRIMVVEVDRSGVAWAEPKDLTLEEVLAAADDGVSKNSAPRSGHPGGINVLLVDGAVRFVPTPMPRHLLETLLTQGFTPEAEEELRRMEDESVLRASLDKDRTNWLMPLTFVVWLGSVAGFGWHAYRVRLAQRTKEGGLTDSAPSTTPPTATPFGGQAP
jgi:prepilin-type processing-associated H-X9-DG protein